MTIQTEWPQGLTDHSLLSGLLRGCSRRLTLSPLKYGIKKNVVDQASDCINHRFPWNLLETFVFLFVCFFLQLDSD